jgi:hypothetical protein
VHRHRHVEGLRKVLDPPDLPAQNSRERSCRSGVHGWGKAAAATSASTSPASAGTAAARCFARGLMSISVNLMVMSGYLGRF